MYSYILNSEQGVILKNKNLSFCKDGGVIVNVKLWFLVVCVRCEVFCHLVVAGIVFLLLVVLILYAW